MKGATLLTIYGRAFDNAPILGMLGEDKSFDDMARQIQPFVRGITANNGGKKVVVAIHLIYAIAVPCSNGAKCLGYLDDTGVDIVHQYIEPAARRGWMVILDDQLGRSSPQAEVRRMIDKGYFRYDNVGAALDPEFATAPDQPTPGIPIGSVRGQDVAAAARLLNADTAPRHPHHRTLLIVHQFQVGMITDRQVLPRHLPSVDITIVADGFGSPGVKAHVYDVLLGRSASANIRWRGIKLFYPNPYEQAGHGDSPVMTWQQVFGRAGDVDEGKMWYVRPPPDIVVIG